ncbi:hypothetical protein [Streptomyces brasiliensis]|uniref:Uncharacterized protein n=1 Tax=Streptomyces brasiliensis TaxID=1954 RepID=A0A917L4K0_9ACTN|nr:hypothetical protein [Streptomyces brasiliensis]GGJ44338.1 hypothetical protein GCM10010121_064420 [Streptomyces brasiliensis]
MRAQRVRRLVAASAAGVLMAGGAAISTAGTAAAAPAVHTRVTSIGCFDRSDWRCFDHGRFGFDHGGFRFDHGGFRFDHRGSCFNHSGFCFGRHFDHRFDRGSFVIIVLR